MNIAALSILALTFTHAYSDAVGISLDRETIQMGESIEVSASVVLSSQTDPNTSREGWLLLPFVNGSRWGAHEWSDAEGRATFHIPLPNVGPQEIQVLAWPANSFTLSPEESATPESLQTASARVQAQRETLTIFERWKGYIDPALIMAGAPMPSHAVSSPPRQVRVERRAIEHKDNGASLIGVQWEPWFTPHNAYWQTAQAVPVMGFYSSYNRDVMRQHLLWFMDLGIDFLLADWSNHLWEKQHWDERGDATAEIIHATELMLQEMATMRDEGFPVPRMVLMPGLSNGPPTTIAALNEMLTWLQHHYLRNPRFNELWQIFDEKPLIVILDTATLAVAEGAAPIDEQFFTVRWMSTQLQRTKHERFGYWSWMDGSLQPVITYRDDKPEAITVTPAYFGHGGWNYPEARGRMNGTTYIESFKSAFEKRPRVIMLHQWNEYAGQIEGQGYGEKKDIYVDSYSVELSDDIEPVSLTTPGYRGDHGGWGYYYANLTQALLALYRGESPETTILAATAGPVEEGSVSLEWSWIGKPPAGFEISLDGESIALPPDAASHRLPVESLPAGEHTVTVRALAAVSRFPLSRTQMDTQKGKLEPVETAVTFVK